MAEMPQAPESEAAVLSAMLMDGESAREARDLLTEEDFYRSAHRAIFRGMVGLLERGEVPSPSLLMDELRGMEKLEEAGGPAYLSKLVDAVWTPENVAADARKVREKAVRRRLIRAARETADEARNGTGEAVEDLLDRAQSRILAVGAARSAGGFATGSDAGMAFFDEVEAARENPGSITGLSTGFSDLDARTNGFIPGGLHVLAGRPGMGKTALALDCSRHVALREGSGVAIFSLEMRQETVLGRMLCAEARVPYQRVRKGRYTDRDAAELSKALGRFKEAGNVWVNDPSSLTVHGIRSSVRRLHDRHGLGLVVVDYLQLMRGPSTAGNREQEVASISRGLKELALELDLPVLALSQLSRAPENRPGSNRPKLTDLRESGAIEQDADLVLFLYRKELELDPTDERFADVENQAEIIIGKQRNGPLGTIDLWFRKPEITFDSFSGRSAEEEAVA